MKRSQFISCLALAAYLFAAGLAAAHVHVPGAADECDHSLVHNSLVHSGHSHSHPGPIQPNTPAETPGDHDGANHDCLVCHFAGQATLAIDVEELFAERELSELAVLWESSPATQDGYSCSRPRAPPAPHFA